MCRNIRYFFFFVYGIYGVRTKQNLSRWGCQSFRGIHILVVSGIFHMPPSQRAFLQTEPARGSPRCTPARKWVKTTKLQRNTRALIFSNYSCSLYFVLKIQSQYCWQPLLGRYTLFKDPVFLRIDNENTNLPKWTSKCNNRKAKFKIYDRQLFRVVVTKFHFRVVRNMFIFYMCWKTGFIKEFKIGFRLLQNWSIYHSTWFIDFSFSLIHVVYIGFFFIVSEYMCKIGTEVPCCRCLWKVLVQLHTYSRVTTTADEEKSPCPPTHPRSWLM